MLTDAIGSVQTIRAAETSNDLLNFRASCRILAVLRFEPLQLKGMMLWSLKSFERAYYSFLTCLCQVYLNEDDDSTSS